MSQDTAVLEPEVMEQEQVFKPADSRDFLESASSWFDVVKEFDLEGYGAD